MLKSCVPCERNNFNSIKVQLKPIKAVFRFSAKRNFNSIKVQLKQRLDQQRRQSPWYFNSIKVQLKRVEGTSISSSIPNFNSIKVQLKRRHLFISNLFRIFQFHKGTIKAPCFWIYNILIFNRICECKVKKSYKKNVDG